MFISDLSLSLKQGMLLGSRVLITLPLWLVISGLCIELRRHRWSGINYSVEIVCELSCLIDGDSSN